MQTYKLLAVLLDYPGGEIIDDLRSAAAEKGGALGLVDSIDRDRLFSAGEHARIAGFIDWALAQDQTELEGRYVKTFDLTPEHSLHLTHHVFGDDKNRGPALIDLSEYYKSFGLQHDEHEIPDYLPMMLEFVSQLEETEARVFLTDAVKVFNVLASNLEKAESPYAALVRVIENHSSLAKLAA
ncbi:nitrate reductase molybdenum cofactor assembly chaperone [Thauera aromatica]|uniref:nitrate reductase molybdenum cofactor assembly chaperone n=1 Tax=Thauera aromatica TaxID=59405 RepID=UPI001FFCC1ED|nr:nitrate reductase molybdenum cofactor assembly chaperone [Thauera aromatica]MCK2094695.1 nitrate reductase molybdenum cofactor assembly chaperone [Thauera aromatica]